MALLEEKWQNIYEYIVKFYIITWHTTVARSQHSPIWNDMECSTEIIWAKNISDFELTINTPTSPSHVSYGLLVMSVWRKLTALYHMVFSHYSDISWALKHHKSQMTWLFVQQLVQLTRKKIQKLHITGPLWRESVDSAHKVRRKHSMPLCHNMLIVFFILFHFFFFLENFDFSACHVFCANLMLPIPHHISLQLTSGVSHTPPSLN